MRLKTKEFDDVVVIEVKGNLTGGPNAINWFKSQTNINKHDN